MRIAIVGPTGHVGNQIVKQLQDQGGHELILLARDAAKLEAEVARGAKLELGDLEDPTFLTNATKGVDALFFMIPPKATAPNFLAYQKEIVKHGAAAVRTNKIPHVVLLSSIGAQHENGTGPIKGLHLAEEALKPIANGLTILRPGSFMENFFMSAGSIAQEGAIYQPAPAEAPMPMIATKDIATVAAQSLVAAAPAGVVIKELAGPQTYSYQQSATILGAALGK
ncbi:MAG: NAD(P)H-binding protein, partial [bacterium]